MDSLPVPEVQIVECGANSESGGRGIGREGEGDGGGEVSSLSGSDERRYLTFRIAQHCDCT